MKKILTILLSLAVVFALASCDGNNPSPSGSVDVPSAIDGIEVPTPSETVPMDLMMKVASVASKFELSYPDEGEKNYYSATGQPVMTESVKLDGTTVTNTTVIEEGADLEGMTLVKAGSTLVTVFDVNSSYNREYTLDGTGVDQTDVMQLMNEMNSIGAQGVRFESKATYSTSVNTAPCTCEEFRVNDGKIEYSLLSFSSPIEGISSFGFYEDVATEETLAIMINGTVYSQPSYPGV